MRRRGTERRAAARVRTLAAILLAGCVAAAGCKPPRSPREAAGESVTGAWIAESADSGRASWSLRLEQRPAGRVSGEGRVATGSGTRSFAVSGVRGESEITLHLDLPGGRAEYHGSVVDVRTIVGELRGAGGPLPVTLRRR